jgi:hypothetical protein
MFSMLTPHNAPLCFATGTACAFIFMRGYSVLPGIWMGSFVAYYLAKVGVWLACGFASIYTLQALILLWICSHYIRPTLVFYQASLYIKFIICCSILTAVSSVIMLLLCYSTTLQFNLDLWLHWWLANLNGILIVSTAIITFNKYFPQINRSIQQTTFQWIAVYTLLVMLMITLLFSHTPLLSMSLAFSIMLVIILMSAYTGWCGAITGLFILGLFLNLGTYMEAPLFLLGTTKNTLIIIELYLASVTATGLLIATLRQDEYSE